MVRLLRSNLVLWSKQLDVSDIRCAISCVCCVGSCNPLRRIYVGVWVAQVDDEALAVAKSLFCSGAPSDLVKAFRPAVQNIRYLPQFVNVSPFPQTYFAHNLVKFQHYFASFHHPMRDPRLLVAPEILFPVSYCCAMTCSSTLSLKTFWAW